MRSTKNEDRKYLNNAYLFSFIQECKKSTLLLVTLAVVCISFVWYMNDEHFSLTSSSNYLLKTGFLTMKKINPGYPVTPYLYSYHYQAYDFSSWEPPEGYTNIEIALSKSRGYLLQNKDGNHKKVVYQLHGGAYITPFSTTYNEIARRYSEIYDDADVFSLDNRVAQQDIFPAALEDAMEGYQWLLSKGYKAEDIVVAGDSSGAGLALSLTLKLRDEGCDLPRGLILASPWANLLQTGFSYITKQNIDVYFGNLEYRRLPVSYAPLKELCNPYVSPVYAEYYGMPPMLIQTGSDEMLLSDSKMIASKALDAGVDVQFKIYEGMWHVFYISNISTHESKVAWQEIENFIEALE